MFVIFLFLTEQEVTQSQRLIQHSELMHVCQKKSDQARIKLLCKVCLREEKRSIKINTPTREEAEEQQGSERSARDDQEMRRERYKVFLSVLRLSHAIRLF